MVNGETTVTFGGFVPSVDEPSGRERGDSPLLDFWAVGCGFSVRGGTSAKGNQWQVVDFRFTDVEVIETDGEPYPFPTASLSMFYNDPTKSPPRKDNQGISEWEALSESIRVIYGDKAGTAILDLFGGQVQGDGEQPMNSGKRMHLKKVPVLINTGPRTADDVAKLVESTDDPAEKARYAKWNKWHDELLPAWKIVEVEGVGSSNGASAGNDIAAYVLGLADGKLPEDFYSVALDDARVMQNPSIINQLNERTFINAMVNINLLTVDANGVLHKV